MSKTVFITGATGAIGEALCLRLIQQPGLHLILAGRNEHSLNQLAIKLRSRNTETSISLFLLDLSLVNQVLDAPKRIAEKFSSIHILINLGAVFLNKKILTTEGREAMYATNFLGTSLLTYGLARVFPSLQVITVAGAKSIHINPQFIQGKMSPFNLLNFLRSKTAAMLFAKKMASILAPNGGCSILFDPGIVKSKSFASIPLPVKLISFLFARPASEAANVLASLITNSNIIRNNGMFLNKKMDKLQVTYLNNMQAQNAVYQYIISTAHHLPT